MSTQLLKRWNLQQVANPVDVGFMSLQLGIKPMLSRILYLRGIRSWDAAKSYFRPEIQHLHDPFLMKGMNEAIHRIEQAIHRQEKILVYGDYDVDGTTAVALLYSFLKLRYTNIDFYIPDRYKEGYGVSDQGVEYAFINNYKLVITLDCGIKAISKVKRAKEYGVDFIICDHHLPGEEVPEAVAILNPKMPDCPYPFKELSGCGIGFKLIQAYSYRHKIPQSHWVEYLDLVAVSIAADIVPIVDENRVLAYYGLRILNNRNRKGFDEILKRAGFTRQLHISDIVFTIAPRINAAGRLANGRQAVDLLITDTPDEALNSSIEIDSTNEERKLLDQETTRQALSMLDEDEDLKNRKSTVLFNPDWHKGVVGIVASRLTEKYYRPTIVLTASNGLATGSARSVKDFDVYQAIEQCSDLLEQYGGHKYAAGLTLTLENIEAFKHRFESIVARDIEEHLLTPEVEIDSEIKLTDIDIKFIRILKQFAPFGPGNMAPVFLCRGVKDRGFVKVVGNKHLKLEITDPVNNLFFPAIAFNLSDFYDDIAAGKTFDVCFTVEENEFNGNITIQLNVKDIRIVD